VTHETLYFCPSCMFAAVNGDYSDLTADRYTAVANGIECVGLVSADCTDESGVDTDRLFRCDCCHFYGTSDRYRFARMAPATGNGTKWKLRPEQWGEGVQTLTVHGPWPTNRTNDRDNRPHFVACARDGSWDLQDTEHNVYAYGSGPSLEACQTLASAALRTLLENMLAQLPNTTR